MMLRDEERAPARSDAELTATIRAGSAGDAELTELYWRHRPAVLGYARTCCRDSHTAEDLTSEAFVRTIQAVRSGHGPEAAWRPYLLAAVRRIATDWGGAAGRIELSPDFEQWLQSAPTEESGEEQLLRREDNELVLEGFRALPERWQAVLWHSVVEEEPAAEVGAILGIGASGVASLAARAREGLREAYLTAHAQSRTASEECRRYSALLGAAVRRSGRRPDRHLSHHLADCARCRHAKFELTDLNQRLRAVLPAGLLLWGGHAYFATRHIATALVAATTPQSGSASPRGFPRKATAWSLGAVTVVVVLAVVLGGAGPQRGHAETSTLPAPPPVTATSSSSSSSPTSSSLAPTQQDASLAPALTPLLTLTPRTELATRLRIASTGNCMEIPGGTRTSGTEPHEAACDGAPEQQWELLLAGKDRHGVQLRNVATQLCLTNSGTRKDGAPVEQATCDPTSPAQLWQPRGSKGRASFVDQSGQMLLGLNDWWRAGQGMPHNTTIGTTHNYYGSTSLALLYDGTSLSS